jgi:hypothetical protein
MAIRCSSGVYCLFFVKITSLRQNILKNFEGLSEVTHIRFQLVFICVSWNWNLIGRGRVEVRNEERRKTGTGRCTGRSAAAPPRPVPAFTNASGFPEDKVQI